VFPGRTREDCRKFENELYNAYQDLKQLHTFIQKHTSSSLVRSGENKSVMQWLKLIFQALNSHDIKSFYCSEYLFEPFYTPSMLEKLRTTGIIVRRDDIKPVLMMHVDAIGIIVLCLLYYDIDEVFAYYGGYLSQAKDGIEDMSLHNLPCGIDGVLCGAVSKYFSFEDYLEMSMVEGVPAEAGSAALAYLTVAASQVQPGAAGTDGLFETVASRGNVWAGGNPTTLSDFDSIIQRLDKQGSIQENVIFLNRSMRPGFAGIENDLLYDAKTTLLFGDAKDSLTKVVSALKNL
jgi:hypothetical protein